MFKLLGTVLILSSGLAFGMAVSQIYTRRQASISSFLQALDIMEKEIVCRLTPIPEIVTCLAQNMSQPYGIFFRRLQQRINQEPAVPLAFQWRKALTEVREDLSLNEEVCAVLSSFAEVIGQYDEEAQQRTLFYISDRLQDALRVAEQEKKSKGKVYRTCSVAVCVLLVILLF